MHRFLKRTEHLVSPVLPAPKKPKVSSKQGAADLLPSGHSSLDYLLMKAGGKLFCKRCNLVIDHHRKFVVDSKV